MVRKQDVQCHWPVVAAAYLLLSLSVVSRSFAQELIGADAALSQIKARMGAAKPEPPKAASPITKFREELMAARAGYAAQSSQEAAATWLKLYDNFIDLRARIRAGTLSYNNNSSYFQLSAVIESLPPPSAWGSIVQLVEARPSSSFKKPVERAALLLLVRTLTKDSTGQTKALASLESLVAKESSQGNSYPLYYLIQVAQILAERSGDPVRIARSVEQRIELQQTERVKVIPDLVTLVGPQKADSLIRRLLLSTTGPVNISQGNATKALAQRLVIELTPKLKVPQWQFAEGIDPVSQQIYRVMDSRFPLPVQKADSKLVTAAKIQYSADGGRRSADIYHAISLIAAGSTSEAQQFLTKVGGQLNDYVLRQVFASVNRGEMAVRFNDFLYAQLKANPDLSFWDVYITAAAKARQTDKMIALLKSSIARPGLDARTRDTLRGYLIKAFLAADDVDQGIALIRAELKEKQVVGVLPSQTFDSILEKGSRLIELGRLLKREPLIEEGIGVCKAALDRPREQPDSNRTDSFLSALISVGRTADAEKLLVDLISKRPSAEDAMVGGYYRGRYSRDGGNDLLGRMVSIYGRAGRNADVLTLLRDAPTWQAKDLAENFSVYVDGDPIGYYAAKALAAAGRKQEALAILHALLNTLNSYDPAYELLIDLEEAEAIPFLDHLMELDRFEERPLIWKAALLLRLKRLPEAEKVALEAISIDPSDGEQGKGRRMRVYSVLADIRQARGDTKQAEFYRGAVKAIRISEDADDYYHAGLLQRGIKMYEEALTHFSNAYCIQSRLAVQLAEEGKMQEAEAHYRRAYELMPDSFGRMESHCFGCEGVFRGQRAENMAERVFKELLAKNPSKPQLHYLLGYLREEQGRYSEALASYQRAVALDPAYINAWRRYASMSKQITMPPKDIDNACLTMLRLDPQQKHGAASIADMSDLQALWKALEQAAKFYPPNPPNSLLPLPASASEIDRVEAKIKERDPSYAERIANTDPDDAYSETVKLPGRGLTRNNLMSMIMNVIESVL